MCLPEQSEEKMYQHAYDKWVWIADNWNPNFKQIENYRDLEKEVPQILQYRSGCSFCEMVRGYHKSVCAECPLYKKYGVGCMMPGNPYVVWAHDGQHKEQAEELRDAIFELAKEAGYDLD